MPAGLIANFGQALLAMALQVVVIVVLASLLMRGGHLVARRTAARLDREGIDAARRARVETLLRTVVSTADVIIIVIASLMVLHAFGVNIAPLLAGVSVAGLAVSLGAQALIRDFIGGFLILFEDQYHVGDVIEVGTTTGTVEEISLRTTRLRDEQGRLWIVPNGEVRIVSNATRDWARAVVDVSVPVGGDAAAVIAALETAVQKLASDQAVQNQLLAAPEVYNWNSMDGNNMQVRLQVKTVAGKQWEVARVMRRYAAAALHAAGKDTATLAGIEVKETGEPTPPPVE